jgi:DNA sulfur modification protein DndD
MLLKKLSLENVGVFRKKQEFELDVTQEKPIILFGGRNGSGKTTVFESIMLCLYGISFFDKKITRKEYEKYLRKKIHRFLGTPISAESASISVEFAFYHQGSINNYSVTRSWQEENGTVKESLVVRKDGKELDYLEQSQWQSFIEELIPRGIAKLFFFDGEKVVKIAQEGSEGIEIQQSFESLLGIELIQQLQADLRVSIMRHLGGDTKEIQEKLDGLTEDKQDSTRKISAYKEKLVSLEEEQKTILQNIDALELKISKIGGGFAQIRQELNEKKAYLQAKLRLVEDNIKNLCAGLLPFCIIPDELKELEKQLLADQEITKKHFQKEILEEHLNLLRKKLKSAEFWEDFDSAKLISKIEDLFAETINGLEKTNQNGVINFSTLDTSNIFALLDRINNEIPITLEKETMEYQKITEELRKVETALANAPKDDEIGPLISELGSLQNNLGMLNNEIDHIQRQIVQEQAMIKMLNNKIRSVVSQKYKTVKSRTHVEMAEKVQEALESYVDRLKAKKLELLENYLLEAIHILMHKENFIEKIKIDKTTFEISLFKKDGLHIPKDMLSEGEKQMLATALLWALAKTSGKPLPFIIDTPLARLDVEHRENLVSRFFPLASHQVLIFSTNSEIDEKYYPKLAPYVNRSYLLAYQSNHGKTEVSDGYFWGVENIAV